jgi:hypothetical protein
VARSCNLYQLQFTYCTLGSWNITHPPRTLFHNIHSFQGFEKYFFLVSHEVSQIVWPSTCLCTIHWKPVMTYDLWLMTHSSVNHQSFFSSSNTSCYCGFTAKLSHSIDGLAFVWGGANLVIKKTRKRVAILVFFFLNSHVYRHVHC